MSDVSQDVSHGTIEENRKKPAPVRRKTHCSCGNPVRPGQGNCDACNAAAQRVYRARRKAELEELRALKTKLSMNALIARHREGSSLHGKV